MVGLKIQRFMGTGGLEYYYLEDETPDPVKNVPASTAYLEGLRYKR